MESFCPRMRTVVLIFALVIAGTSSCTMEDQNHYYVTPELQPFVENFYKHAGSFGLDLQRNNVVVVLGKLAFSEDPHGSNGVTNAQTGVTLDVNFVTQKLATGSHTDSIQVEYVVFHELGHYLLHRNHLSPENYTIMTAKSSYLGDYRSYPEKRERLIRELFQQAR